ncbi:MAG TPA: RHS repeat-associated core domain-containing protein [Thermoanaerobaculia bacterium]|nr:RHS repeat-associated core domain-containing protein [Thermoanaerobaculia bacterium]
MANGQPDPQNPLFCDSQSFCTLRNCQTPFVTDTGNTVIPTGLTYTVRRVVEVKAPYNWLATQPGPNNNPNGTLNILWSNSSGGQVSLCQYLATDHVYTYLEQKGLTCFGAPYNFGSYIVRADTCQGACPVFHPCFPNCAACGWCGKSTQISVAFAVTKAELGCPAPPPDDCTTNTNQCRDCRPAGGGCSFSAEGKVSCEFGGHGAPVRYRAGGAGGDNFPGTPGWRTALGLYISHAYAQRIVMDPDVNHVWLITDGASFRELRNPAAGTGLRLYDPTQTVPSDEYRKLYFDSATGGWQLDSLNGRKDFFRPDGLWDKTVLSQNPTNPTQAIYNASNQLDTVLFPDQRRETFTYDASGKLASITEVPVPGSVTPPRTWSYAWSGDVLTNIGRPDGTSWELTYDPAKNGGRSGYLTQLRLIGTDGVSGRVEAAFEYDSFGNVNKSWRGDPVYTGPNAVNRQELTYTNPQSPTRTDVLEWINSTQNQVTSYEYDRDPRGIKMRINKITGDCPLCGTGPNSQLTYADAANPLRPTQIIDGRGLKTQFSYDANGQTTSKTEAVGTSLQRLTTWQYGNSSFPALLTRIEMPSTSGGSAQRVTVLAYDASGNLTTRTSQGAEAGSSFSFVSTSTFNGAGQPLVIDPPGYGTADQTTYTYDSTRGDLLPLTRTDPLIGTTSFAYDGLNRRTSVTDPNNVQTLTDFDTLSRVTAVTRKGDGDLVTTYQYTFFGDLFRTILPQGHLIEYGYDPAGRQVSIERKPDAATHGERTFYTLDTVGHRTKEELQHWNGSAWVTDSFTDFVYSSRCHLDKAVNADGTATEYAYDCDGNLEKMWDANHPKASNPIPTQLYAYDSLNRLTSLIQPWTGAGGTTAVTAHVYDVQDHLTGVTDAEGNSTTYTTSDRDLQTQQVSPVSGTTAYTFNEHGDLVTTTDARNIVTSRTVDAADRVTQQTFGPSGSPDSTLTTTYAYGSTPTQFDVGRLIGITRNGQTIAYTYDRFGRVIQDGTLSYQYDKNGNRAQITYPGGVVATYTFDFADRDATLSYNSGSGPQPLVTASAYKPFGPLSSLSLANGLTETRLFDNRYRPDRIQAGSLLDWDYTEDAVGNPTQIAGTIVSQPYTATFAYQDPQYFLTQGNGPWGTRAWTYDRIGNRLSHQETGEPTQTYTYAGSGHNPKLAQITPAPGLGTGSRQLAYDAAGNQISVQETDAEGAVETTFLDASQESRLSALRPGAGPGRSDLLYDGRGFLRQALLTFAGSMEHVNVTPSYSSEGLLLARAEERLWSGSAPGPDGEDNIGLILNQETTQIFYFAGRPVAQLTTGPELLYLTTDHLGTPVLATNTSGAAIWAGGLEPFGRAWTAGSNPDPEPLSAQAFHRKPLIQGKALNRLPAERVFLRYPGQWVSDAFRVGPVQSDFYYNMHRWYEPQTGRYSQPDSIGLKGGNNLYLYAGANPARYTDPQGLQPLPRPCGPDDIADCQRDCSDRGLNYVGCQCFSEPLCGGLFGFISFSVTECRARQKGCPSPCPQPLLPVIDRVPPSRPHPPCPGDHWHYFRYDQSPAPECICRLQREFGGCL